MRLVSCPCELKKQFILLVDMGLYSVACEMTIKNYWIMHSLMMFEFFMLQLCPHGQPLKHTVMLITPIYLYIIVPFIIPALIIPIEPKLLSGQARMEMVICELYLQTLLLHNTLFE